MTHRFHLGRAAMVDYSDRGPSRAPVPAEWSAKDRAPLPRGPRRGATGGEALASLASKNVDGHAVVVGCVDDDVLAAVTAAAERTTVLVRGSVDAEQIEDRFPAATVLCGDLADLMAHLSEPVSVVVALDGLDRIQSVETEPDTWSVRLDLLRGLLSDPSRILLTVRNPLAPAALVQVPSERSADSDADWGGVDPTAPLTLESALAALPGAGAYALFGPPQRPAVALPAPIAAHTLHAALAVAHGATGGVLDERSMLRVAADAGRLADLGNAWVLVPGALETPARGPRVALFEEAFLDAASARDISAARALLRAAVDVVATPALPHTVVAEESGTCSVLDVAVDVSADPLLAFCCALATRIDQLGARHPWPFASDRAELARVIAAAAGHDVSVEQAAAALPPVPESTPDAARVDAERTALVRERERGHRELVDILEKRAASQHDALEARKAELARANADLKAARAELAAVRGSASFRVGRLATAPIRRLRAARTLALPSRRS